MTADKDTRPRLVQILAGLVADIDQIHDDLGWTHNLGWDAPAQLKRQDQRGASLTRTTTDDDQDHVAAARHDTGLGVDAARHAFRTASAKLPALAHHLGRALRTLEPDTLIVEPRPPTNIRAAHNVARHCARLAGAIHRHAANLDPKQYPRHLEQHVLDSHAHARSTLGVLAAPLNRDRPNELPDEDTCRICEVRPAHARKGGRCSTCSQWFHLHGKRERPRTLDKADVDEALQAKARRRARGEDWGAA